MGRGISFGQSRIQTGHPPCEENDIKAMKSAKWIRENLLERTLLAVNPDPPPRTGTLFSD